MIDQRRLFIISTAHLKRETAEAHNTYDEKGFLWPIPYGYICWMWDLDDFSLKKEFMEDIFDIVHYLRQNHKATSGDYIRFDCDAEILPDLKTYNW